MIVNFILDHIPVWVYVVVGLGIFGVLMFYFSAVLIPIWNLLPNWLKWAIGFVIAMFLAVAGGRYKGRKDADEEQRQRDADATKNRKVIDDDVNKLDRPAVNKQLDPWMRDPP